MRANRLIRLILALGDGRRRTAAALAAQLEVSERTILRDVDALGIAGIPVTATRGPDGGIALPRTWARPVSGLFADEVAGLAALSVPAVLGGVSLDRAADVALAKVLAALPAVQRAQAEEARQRLLVDPSPWWADATAPACLDTLRDAVFTERLVRLVYAGRARTVRPLGLVVKADRWYLVADTDGGRRTFRGDRVEAAEALGERFERDPDFDLRAAWQEAKASFVASRPSYPVTLVLTDAGRTALAALRPTADHAALVADPAVVDFQCEHIALAQLVLLGGEARVLAPMALVERMREVAAAWREAGEGG